MRHGEPIYPQFTPGIDAFHISHKSEPHSGGIMEEPPDRGWRDFFRGGRQTAKRVFRPMPALIFEIQLSG